MTNTEFQDQNTPSRNTQQYVVVARRYRPQDFDDLVGQSQASTALKNAIQQNRVGHAYLFTGARGVGKTSTARIFAKCLNCQKGPTIEPCNQCDICVGISTGEDVDVLEIDGASNRGIDEIRQLRSNASIRPSRARNKVYIIDEVHMLTTAAFNALLKTLEEPPPHVKFIFCTTDPEKIPITVLSRCQRFDFVPVKLDEIKNRLSEIVATENLTADPDALALIARRAGGSMRDSQSLLEQVFSYCDGHITLQNVNELLGTADSELVHTIGQHLLNCESGKSLSAIYRGIQAGVDPGQLAEQLVAFYRDLMIVKVGGADEILNVTGAGEVELLKCLGNEVPIERIMSSIQILDQSISRMRYSAHAQVLVELAAVRICNLQAMNDLAALVDHVKSGSVPTGRTATNSNDSSKSASLPSAQKKNENEVNQTAVKQTDDNEPADHRTLNRPLTSPVNSENIESIWTQVLTELADLSAEMAKEFRSLKLESPNRIVVAMPDQAKCDYCSQPSRKKRFEQVFASISGQSCTVDFRPIETSSTSVEPTKPAKTNRQIQRELEQNPLVSAAIKLFDGHVIDLKRPVKR